MGPLDFGPPGPKSPAPAQSIQGPLRSRRIVVNRGGHTNGQKNNKWVCFVLRILQNQKRFIDFLSDPFKASRRLEIK